MTPRRWIAAGVLTVVLAAAYLALPFTVSFAADVRPRIDGPQGLVVTEYGDKGTHFVRYTHGERFTVTVPLRNDGPLPVSVTEVRMTGEVSPLVEVREAGGLPVTIDPGETVRIALHARFANCRYYHERAVQTMPDAIVRGEVLGRSFTERAAFDRPVAVHSQVILRCPERTLIRGDDVRGAEPGPGRGVANG